MTATGTSSSSPWVDPLIWRTVRRQGLAGAAGGFAVFLLLAPIRGEGGGGDLFDGLPQLLLPGIVFGGLVTAALVAAEEAAAGRILRLLVRTVGSGMAGAVLGAGYSVLGHLMFVLASSGLPGGNLLARAMAWALFGLGTGLSAGIAANSGRRAYPGCAGGLAGGFLAGLVFELLPLPSEVPVLGALRLLVGFVLLGGAVGAATALSEQLQRTAWVTFLTGSREGQDVALYRDRCILGSDEMIDVPLFGDPTVPKQHIEISFLNPFGGAAGGGLPVPLLRLMSAGAAVLVDGAPVHEGQTVPLRDGILLCIGSHRLLFRCRGGRVGIPAGTPPPSALLLDRLLSADGPAPSLTAPPPLPGYAAAGGFPIHPASAGVPAPGAAPYPPSAPNVPDGRGDRTMVDGSAPGTWTEVADEGLVVRILSGPAAGWVMPLAGETITLGRDPGNTLSLPDGRVSRCHARMDFMDGSWVLSDLGSTNGTWLNGLRITRAGLSPGDRIEVGGTAMHVEGPPARGSGPVPGAVTST